MYNLLKIINVKVFLVSLLVGLLYIYLMDSRKKITVFPNPSNIHKVEYKDKADSCFKFKIQ